MLVAQPRSVPLFWGMELPLVANLGPSSVRGIEPGGVSRVKEGKRRKENRCGVWKRRKRLYLCTLSSHPYI